MALSLQEYLNKLGDVSQCAPTKCSLCGKPIDEHSDIINRINGKQVCEDCFFAKLGEEVEKCPISSPRVRRG